MKFIFMRYMDRYAGRFLISLLVVFDWFRRMIIGNPPKKPDQQKVRTIVVEKFFGLGSILYALPLLSEIRSHFPSARIVFVTFEANREILDIVGAADEVVSIRSENFRVFAWDCARAIFRFWRLGVDICIDLEFFSKFSMLMSYMTGARTRVGFFAYFNVRSVLLTHPTAFNHYKPVSRAYLAMAEALGLEISGEDQSFSLPSMRQECEKGLFRILGGNKPFVAINPNASSLCELRRWPQERFVELVSTLLRKYPQYRYVLIGAPSEKKFVQQIVDACGAKQDEVINTAGKTDIRHLMALLETAQLLISNDSGPVHLAAGYQANTLVLFGPETPVLYRPPNPNAHILYKDLYCSPCINVLDNKSFEECTTTECMRGISVEEVLENAETHFLKKPDGK